jgi:hypothetical protein
LAVKNSSDVGGSEREPKVARIAGVDGIDGESAGFCCGTREGFLIQVTHKTGKFGSD